MALSKRSVAEGNLDVRSLPLPETVTLLQPENTVLDFGRGVGMLDFGALCFSHRNFGVRTTHGTAVTVSSLNAIRQEKVQLLIKLVSRQVETGAHTRITLKSKFGDFIRFIDWCDQNGHQSVLDNEPSMRVAIRAFSNYLQHQIDTHELTKNTASPYQRNAIAVLQELSGADDLGAGVRVHRTDWRLINSTRVPDEDAVGAVIVWCEHILNGFTDLIVNHKPYPFAFRVPDRAGLVDNQAWAFPLKPWIVLPNGESAKSHNNIHLDYTRGRVLEPEEVYPMVSLYPRSKIYPSHIRAQNTKIRELIEDANLDPLHKTRLDRGMTAVYAYLLMILAASGQNLATILLLPWSEELEEVAKNPDRERQSFRTIKYRAGGAEIVFEVGPRHMPFLRNYLKLRKHLLQGIEFDRLFFTFGRDSGQRQVKTLVGADAIKSAYLQLTYLDASLPRVMSRQFRAAKQDFLIRITDPASSAILMQQSLDRANKSYTHGSQVTHATEMTAFWRDREQKIKEATRILDPGNSIQGGEERTNGMCESPLHPEPIMEDPPVIPDCRQSEGCLFCVHHCAHADEKDIRKLLSAQFCINLQSRHARNKEDFDSRYGPVLARIGHYIEKIRERVPDLVEAIAHQVSEEGNLDPYWAAKMEVLVELEAIS